MSGERPSRECRECGAPLYLLQTECEECATSHAWACLAPCQSCGTRTDYLDGACESCGATHSPWRVAELAALDEEPVTVSKAAVQRPTEAGYQRHVGTVRGQWADYRRERDDGSEFHVRVFLDHYELHVDAVSALEEPTRHTLRYGPRAAVTTGRNVLRGVRGAAERASGLARTALGVPASFLPDLDGRSRDPEER